jgi:hypothetical protein
MSKEEDIAMQVRCVHCGCEQYGMSVHPVSMGDMGCYRCGELSKKMTEKEYRDALKAQREKERADNPET